MIRSGDGEKVALKRTVGFMSACGIIVGTIIGSGIFVSPKGVIQEVGSVGLSLMIWMLCGCLTLLGALCYSELGTMIPFSGGAYSYIKYAFGDVMAFLYMWAIIVVVMPTLCAIMSLTFAENVLQVVFPDCQSPQAAILLLAALAIATLTFVNMLSVVYASRVQNVCTVIKVFALVSIIAVGFWKIGQGRVSNFQNSFEGSVRSPGAIALAFYSGIFSFSGWDSLNILVEELKNPYKNLPRAILMSIPAVTIVYVLVNIAYFSVLTPQRIVDSDAVAVTFAMETFGPAMLLIPISVAFSTFGSLNGTIMCIGRLFYVGARDGNLPAAIALVSLKRYTPITAVAVLGLQSIIMLFMGDVYALINYATFVEVSSFFMSVSVLLYLRWKEPNMKRPIQIPLVVPVVYMCVCVFLLVTTLVTAPRETGMALLIMLSGLPVYLIGVQWQAKPKVITNLNEKFTTLLQKLSYSAMEEID